MYIFHRMRINPLKIPAVLRKGVCDLSVLFLLNIVICFAECELDCSIVLTMLTQTEQQTL